MTKQNPFTTPFRQKFLACRFNGNLKEDKCEHCGSLLLRCTKYGGLCSSKHCKEGMINERRRMMGELENEIERTEYTLNELDKTEFNESNLEKHTILWKKVILLKIIIKKLQKELMEGTVKYGLHYNDKIFKAETD